MAASRASPAGVPGGIFQTSTPRSRRVAGETASLGDRRWGSRWSMSVASLSAMTQASMVTVSRGSGCVMEGKRRWMDGWRGREVESGCECPCPRPLPLSVPVSPRTHLSQGHSVGGHHGGRADEGTCGEGVLLARGADELRSERRVRPHSLFSERRREARPHSGKTTRFHTHLSSLQTATRPCLTHLSRETRVPKRARRASSKK